MSVRVEITFTRRTVLGFAAFAIIIPAGIAAVTIPNVFTNDSIADASHVNTNFSTLGTAVTTLETTVAGNRVPVGTILAWHKSLSGTPTLPAGGGSRRTAR